MSTDLDKDEYRKDQVDSDKAASRDEAESRRISEAAVAKGVQTGEKDDDVEGNLVEIKEFIVVDFYVSEGGHP